MNRAFSSALAAELAAFIDFKHKIGVTFTTGEYYLWRLDEYCVHRGVTALTRAVSEITNQLAVLIVRILAGVVGFSFA